MEYNSLDKLFERAEHFNMMADDIYERKKYLLNELVSSIIKDERLIKIFKITEILKNTNHDDLNFNDIKNIDDNFICDADKIIIKSNTNPIRLYLTFNSEENCFNSEVFGYDNTNDLYNFYKNTIDNIEKFEQKFLNKIDDIFIKQDDEYDALFS